MTLLNPDDAQEKGSPVTDRQQVEQQFSVTPVPFHRHTGGDSPSILFGDIKQRILTLPVVIPGASAQTAANYGVFITMPYNGIFLGASEVHRTAEATSTTCTLQIEHLISTTASGSGTNLLQSVFDLMGTANTVVNSTKANIASPNFSLAKGDRLGLVFTSSGAPPVNLAQVVVTVLLQY